MGPWLFSQEYEDTFVTTSSAVFDQDELDAMLRPIRRTA